MLDLDIYIYQQYKVFFLQLHFLHQHFNLHLSVISIISNVLHVSMQKDIGAPNNHQPLHQIQSVLEH